MDRLKLCLSVFLSKYSKPSFFFSFYVRIFASFCKNFGKFLWKSCSTLTKYFVYSFVVVVVVVITDRSVYDWSISWRRLLNTRNLTILCFFFLFFFSDIEKFFIFLVCMCYYSCILFLFFCCVCLTTRKTFCFFASCYKINALRWKIWLDLDLHTRCTLTMF